MTGLRDAMAALREPAAIEKTTKVEEPAPRRSLPANIPAPAKRPGRPPGKRSNPDYGQFTVLLKRATHQEAVDQLRHSSERRDFAELVQELLEKWLKQRK